MEEVNAKVQAIEDGQLETTTFLVKVSHRTEVPDV